MRIGWIGVCSDLSSACAASRFSSSTCLRDSIHAFVSGAFVIASVRSANAPSNGSPAPAVHRRPRDYHKVCLSERLRAATSEREPVVGGHAPAPLTVDEHRDLGGLHQPHESLLGAIEIDVRAGDE